MALKALGIGNNDNVITVPNTAIPTVSAIRQAGARPVFVDVNQYGLMDHNMIRDVIDENTKAIIPVHLYGFPCNMSAICEIAKKAKEAGAKSISLISAVGADKNSWNYYLKTKGMLEEEIIKLGFSSIDIYQPGHLMGNKFRLDIVLADIVSFILDPFLHGPLKKFRSISAEKLSVAVVKNSLQAKAGINYFDYKDFI